MCLNLLKSKQTPVVVTTRDNYGRHKAIKPDGEHSLADASTEAAGALNISTHIQRVGRYTSGDGHVLAPKWEDDTEGQHTGDQEGEQVFF